MLSSLGMALDPLLGGWSCDRFGSYAWLYLGSLAVGLAAAGTVMAFPRTPAQRSGIQAAVAQRVGRASG